MADETQNNSATTILGADDSPGANLIKTPEQLRAEADQPIADSGRPVDDAAPAADHPAPAEPPAPLSAAERLRAFEDAEVGKDAVRIGGRIERGYGSPFAALSAEKKRQYAALGKLVAAEQKLADAHAALIQAEADHQAALAEAEPMPDAPPAE